MEVLKPLKIIAGFKSEFIIKKVKSTNQLIRAFYLTK
jgi:hypothetical protein